MISPVNSQSSVQVSGATPPKHNPPPAQQKTNPPQDTVKLSPEARAASGDVDHDGDSH